MKDSLQIGVQQVVFENSQRRFFAAGGMIRRLPFLARSMDGQQTIPRAGMIHPRQR
jgi:hypothetical protein